LWVRRHLPEDGVGAVEGLVDDIAVCVRSRYGVFTFGLMFLSGLWVNPAQLGDPLRTIMYYSPSGAAVKAVLDSALNGGLSYAALLTMAVYTVIFGFIAIRYFRWE
jgi:ABC-type multidrug transport system permease subunit